MSSVVLDASAALAMILDEPGGNRVLALLRNPEAQIAMGVVNWCEVLTRLQRDSLTVNGKKLASVLPGVEIIPFEQPEAEFAADLSKSCPGLSLGDRACLALAASRKAVAWTADKQWVRWNTNVKLEILR